MFILIFCTVANAQLINSIYQWKFLVFKVLCTNNWMETFLAKFLSIERVQSIKLSKEITNLL